jgi:hypothetical protein
MMWVDEFKCILAARSRLRLQIASDETDSSADRSPHVHRTGVSSPLLAATAPSHLDDANSRRGSAMDRHAFPGDPA